MDTITTECWPPAYNSIRDLTIKMAAVDITPSKEELRWSDQLSATILFTVIMTGLTLRRKYLHKVLSKEGPSCDEDWEAGPAAINALETSKIL